MYEDDDYMNAVNHNERQGDQEQFYKNDDDGDDLMDRDYSENNTDRYNNEQYVVNNNERSFDLGRSNNKERSVSKDKKPHSTGNFEQKQHDETQKKTFKLTLKQTLPRPQDITDDDKQFLLPKIQAQNDKLKDQVNDLLDLLEQHSLNFYSKKNERYKPQKYEPDGQLKSRDKVLLDKLNQIKHYQREIKDLRKQLQDSYNIERLLELENDIKTRQNKIKELKEDEQALKRVQHEQSSALQSINREGDYEQQIYQMADQLRTFKQQYRQLYYEQLDKDKQLIDRHEGLVKLGKKVKKMQKQIDQKLGGASPQVNAIKEQKITKETLKMLRDEINECRQNRKEEEKMIKSKLQDQDEEIESLEHEVKLLELQVREKEHQNRLADLKIKELKRSVRHKVLKPLAQSPQMKTQSKDSRIKYNSQSDMAGSKILRKKLENGRVTYQDVILTEENVKLHEQKYQQQIRLYQTQDQQKPSEDVTKQVYMNPQQNDNQILKPNMNIKPKLQVNNEYPVQNQEPKRLGPSPQQNNLQNTQNANTDIIKKQSPIIDTQNSDTLITSARQNGVYSKPSIMSKKKV